MADSDDHSFWDQIPKSRNYKKTAIIIISVFVVVLSLSGVALSKYGYSGIKKNTQTTPTQNTKNDIFAVGNSAGSELNSNSNNASSISTDQTTITNSSSLLDTNSNKNSSSFNSSKQNNNSNNKFATPIEYDKTGAIAICNDYTYSHEQHNSNTCSSHSGVMYWLDGTDSSPAQKKKVCVENTSMIQALEQQYKSEVSYMKREKERELGQARADLASRGGDNVSGAYLSEIQGIENKYDLQFLKLENEYNQKIDAVEPICHNE